MATATNERPMEADITHAGACRDRIESASHEPRLLAIAAMAGESHTLLG
jgi:hypothetical protein